MDQNDQSGPATVGLFATCLVDLFRPSVGFATARLIEAAGFAVAVPPEQTCCGQPAYNAGDRAGAMAIAKRVIAAFEGFEHVVAPSGSCAAMLKHHYPALFAADADWAPRAATLAGKTRELTDFLVRVAEWKPAPGVRTPLRVTYHDSCSGLRELGVRDQPRALLDAIETVERIEMEDAEICCGFGGAFCVKYPEISQDMADKKIAAVENAGADVLLAGDLGCLLHLAGRLKRLGLKTETRHVAEILAGEPANPAIAEPRAG